MEWPQTFVGYIFVICAPVIAYSYIIGTKKYKGWVTSLCLIIMFFGVVLINISNVKDFSIFKDTAKISMAVKSATADAKTVEDLKNRIENQSATIDIVANSANQAKELSIEAADKIEQINTKLTRVNKVFSETQSKQNALNEIVEISQIIMDAEHDSRDAFNYLASFPRSSKFYILASEVCLKIRMGFSLSGIQPSFTTVNWRGNDPSKTSIQKFRYWYSTSHQIFHADFIYEIYSSKIITRKEKMQFFVDVLNNDSSLTATYYAGVYFCELSQNNDLIWEPFNTDNLLKWWDTNKNKIK